MSYQCTECGIKWSYGSMDANPIGVVCERCLEGESKTAMKMEIERLRSQLADSVSNETRISLEQERDEAREAARTIGKRNGYIRNDLNRWPWLEDE